MQDAGPTARTISEKLGTLCLSNRSAHSNDCEAFGDVTKVGEVTEVTEVTDDTHRRGELDRSRQD
jgi:hypothetical protein